jgi:hypothetical protein
MVTVPSCRRCNGEKSKDDDYLRDMLVTDISTSFDPTARAIKDGKLRRAVGSRRSHFVREFLPQARPDTLRSKGGIIVAEDVYSAPANGQRIERIFSRILRGLFYHKFKLALPPKIVFEVRRVQPPELAVFFRDILGSPTMNGPHGIGDIFKCWEMHATEDQRISYWVLLFYGGYVVTVATELPESITAAA